MDKPMDHWLKKKIGFQNYYWATIVLSSVFFTFVFISTFSSSLDWALTSDNAIMSYSSWMIKSGKVPYKDIFDFNLPGTYLVHIFSLTLFNSNVEIGYRVLELLLLLSINVISVLPLNIPIRQRIPLLGIAFIFNTHIIIQGPNMAFQRDTWIALGLAIFIIKTHFDSNYSELVIRGRNVSLFFDFFTQFIIGFLACVKPSILILGFIPILIAKTGHRRLISILGLGFPILLILIWLAMVGGLRDFIDIFYNYIWKLYPSALITGPFYHLNQEFIFNIPIIMGGLGGLITIFIYKQYKTA
ncbi:MAG TPA: hypothetical protein VLA32_01595, partial [Anaerolineales bacterium]|nr:hypothetical protein [Anaerolineales bacterium]